MIKLNEYFIEIFKTLELTTGKGDSSLLTRIWKNGATVNPAVIFIAIRKFQSSGKGFVSFKVWSF